MNPDLSVVVVSFMTRQLTLSALESIARHTRTASYEIVAVDNASSDGSADAIAASFPDARLIRHATNVGFVRAVNQAIAACRGEFVVLLNSDAYLEQDALGPMMSHARSDARVGALGCRVVNPDGSYQPTTGRFPRLALEWSEQFLRPVGTLPEAWRQNCIYASDRSAPTEVDWIAGSCLLLRRRALDDVGGFDEQFVFGEEDIDLARRLRESGWTVVYYPGVSAVHVGGASRRSNRDAGDLWLRGRYRLYRKHRGAAYARVYQGTMMLSYAARWAAAALSRARGPAPPARTPAAYARSLRAILGW
jgi:GT2 family glycosyltransferase